NKFLPQRVLASVMSTPSSSRSSATSPTKDCLVFGKRVFLIPGAAMLWIEYHFPRRGGVIATGRRYRSQLCRVIYSAVFWGFALALIGAQIYGAFESNH